MSLIASRKLALLIAVLAAGALTGTAQAATPAQPPSSAIAQYVEMIPTGSGAQAVGVGVTQTTKLPPRISAKIRIQGGASAPTLELIATSSAYGAPTLRPAAAPTKVVPKAPSQKPEPRVQPPIATGSPMPPASLSHALSVALPTAVSGSFLGTWLGLIVLTSAAFAIGRRTRKR